MHTFVLSKQNNITMLQQNADTERVPFLEIKIKTGNYRAYGNELPNPDCPNGLWELDLDGLIVKFEYDLEWENICDDYDEDIYGNKYPLLTDEEITHVELSIYEIFHTETDQVIELTEDQYQELENLLIEKIKINL